MFQEFYERSMEVFSNTEKVSKICVKTMVKSCENDVFTYFEIYLMLIICYFTLTLHWLGLRFLSISLCFYNLCAYSSVTMIWLMLLAYIILFILQWSIYIQLLWLYYEHFWVRIPIWISIGRLQVWWNHRVTTVTVS